MKVIKISLVIALFCSFTSLSIAQSESKKKIVVIEKVSDENGVVTNKKVVKEGEEAEQYLREKKIELELTEEVKHIKKEVEVEVRNTEVKENKKIQIRIRENDGEEKVIEWDGEGEIPEEMKMHMQEADVDIDMQDMGQGDMRVAVRTSIILPKN